MEWFALCAARVHFFLFRILFSVIFGIGDVRTADMVVSEFSGTHFGGFCVVTVLWNVT